MSNGPTATETLTSAIPGTENMAHETALQRASQYPLVKDTLTTAHAYVQAHPYANAVYERAAALSMSILSRLEPLQKRLPLETVDGYANGALDFVEKRFPQVKMETGDLYSKVRQPADQAVEYAQTYRKGFEDRVGPVTEQFYARVAQSQETLGGLQKRLAETVAKLPHDQKTLKKTMADISNELDSIVKAVPSIPGHAQATAKPYIDGLVEAATYVKKEITRDDIPVGARASNILQYSHDKLGPVLESVKSFAFSAKKTAVEKKEATVNGSH
ncbi:hypothetical protein JCM1840_000805 [Sporobolomyces johnsonii]